MLERNPPSAPRQPGRLFVSDKKPDGSFILKFRPDLEPGSPDVIRGSRAKEHPDQETGEPAPMDSRVLSQNEESASLKPLAEQEQDQILDAAGGLTTIEAENAFALSVVEKKAIDPVIVAREKAQAVKKVDRIRANTDGERQLTGCAFTLGLVREWPSPRATERRRSDERPSSRRRPKR